MAHVTSGVRSFVKPLLFKLLGEKGYFWFQVYGKLRDIRYRLVEEDEMALLPFFIGDRDEVLDLGANYAYYSERMSHLCRTGKVYAFEPIPFTYRVCKKIIGLKKLHNVELYQLGVGNSNEKLTFEVPLADFGAISAGQSHIAGRNNDRPGKERLHNFDAHQLVEAEIVRVDDFLPNLSRLSFVKLDIEGAEYMALEGMKKTLDRFHPVILIEVVPFFLEGFGIPEAKLVALIEDMGYLFFLYDPASKKLNKANPPLLERNYILIHRSKAAEFENIIENAE